MRAMAARLSERMDEEEEGAESSVVLMDDEHNSANGYRASKRVHVVDADDSSLRNDILKRRKPSTHVNNNVAVSQELRCPICLAGKEDTTMLSECQHAFCHACILEWLKMKPECPLCKRVPKFFKHNFDASDRPPTWETPGQLESVSDVRAAAEMESILVASAYAADVEHHAVQHVVQRLEEEIRLLEHMKLRTYTGSADYAGIIKATQVELAEYQRLAAMFGTSSRRELFREPAFRRVVYIRNLSPRSIVAPHFAVVFNADHVRANEAAVRGQLLPFIIREFTAITRQTSVDVDELMRVIFDYLAQRAGRMQAVHYMQLRGVRHPHHFLNNLTHFAGTGQTLDVYDQNSEYTPRSPGVLPYMSGSDDILVLNSAVNNDVQVVGESSAPAGRGGGVSSRNLDSNRRTLEHFSRRLAALTGATFRTRTSTAAQSSQRAEAVADPYDFHSSIDYLIGRQSRTAAALAAVNTVAAARNRSGQSPDVVVNIDDSDNDGGDADDSDDSLEELQLEEMDDNGAEVSTNRRDGPSTASGNRFRRGNLGRHRQPADRRTAPIVVDADVIENEDAIELADDVTGNYEDDDIATID